MKTFMQVTWWCDTNKRWVAPHIIQVDDMPPNSDGKKWWTGEMKRLRQIYGLTAPTLILTELSYELGSGA